MAYAPWLYGWSADEDFMDLATSALEEIGIDDDIVGDLEEYINDCFN